MTARTVMAMAVYLLRLRGERVVARAQAAADQSNVPGSKSGGPSRSRSASELGRS